jgi:hypothetical protein
MDENVTLEKTNPSEPEQVEQPVPSNDEPAPEADKTEPTQDIPDGGEPSEPSQVEDKVEKPELSPRAAKRLEKLVEKIQGGKPTELPQDPTPSAEQINRQMIQEELAVRDFANNYKTDQITVQTSYPILKEKPSLLKAIDTLYESAIGYNPKNNTVQRIDIGYAEFVEAYMEGAKELSSYESSKVANDVAEQASQQAINSSGATNSPQKLSREVIAKMSNDEYVRRRDEINAWVAKQ